MGPAAAEILSGPSLGRSFVTCYGAAPELDVELLAQSLQESILRKMWKSWGNIWKIWNILW
jgi:hypothetical protein